MTDQPNSEEVKRRRAYAEWYAKKEEEVRKKREAEYRAASKAQKIKKPPIYRRQAAYDRRVRDSKKFFCEDCDVSFACKRELERHEESKKHQYAVLINSLD